MSNKLQQLKRKKSDLESSIGVLLVASQGDPSVLPSIQSLEAELAAVDSAIASGS